MRAVQLVLRLQTRKGFMTMQLRNNKATATDAEHREGRALARKIIPCFKTAKEANLACGLSHGHLSAIDTCVRDTGRDTLAKLRTAWERIEKGEIGCKS
jgi:hypothetical protein